MQLVTSAIVPILLLLALGWVLRHHLVTDPGYWQGLELLSYRVFTPALFITTIYDTDLRFVPLAALLLALGAPVLVVSCILLALKRPCGPTAARLVAGAGQHPHQHLQRTCVPAALPCDDGVATFALASAVRVPLLNVVLRLGPHLPR